MNVPKYRRWSPSAIDCYNRRGCVCDGCLTGQIMEQRCRMKYAVIELVKTLGPPKIYNTNFIPGATEQEEAIIRAIVEGASDLKQIAENLELSERTIKPRLCSLYRLIEDQGYQFKTSKQRNRLPEFIEYIKALQPKDDTPTQNSILDEETVLKGNSIMYDEDLKLEYANYLAPIIDAIKKGYERLVDIEKQTGIPQTSISAGINQFAHRLEKLGLIKFKKEIGSRQTVINFIQSRLLDPEYKEETKTEQLSDNDKSKDNTELRAENEQLRKRIEELEKQTQTVVKCDLSSFKEKINQDIQLLNQKLKLIEELEKDMSL